MFQKIFRGEIPGGTWGPARSPYNLLRYGVLKRNELSKKYFFCFLNFAPVFEIWPPKVGRFFESGFPKNLRGPSVRGLGTAMALCTDSITATWSDGRFNNIWGVCQAVEGTCPSEYAPFQEVDFGNF